MSGFFCFVLFFCIKNTFYIKPLPTKERSQSRAFLCFLFFFFKMCVFKPSVVGKTPVLNPNSGGVTLVLQELRLFTWGCISNIVENQALCALQCQSRKYTALSIKTLPPQIKMEPKPNRTAVLWGQRNTLIDREVEVTLLLNVWNSIAQIILSVSKWHFKKQLLQMKRAETSDILCGSCLDPNSNKPVIRHFGDVEEI